MLTLARAAGLAAWLIALLLGAALILAPEAPSAKAQTISDWDSDDDGLIDLGSIDQLAALRIDRAGEGLPLVGRLVALTTQQAYDAIFPNRDKTAGGLMGCPSGVCRGYELWGDFTFDENGDGQMTETGDPTYWNSGAGWEPIPYDGDFEGNGHTISYLYINRTTTSNVGLFATTGSGSDISGVGLPHADVRGANRVGALIGRASGTITKAWVTGSVQGTGFTGGLAGQTSGLDIKASWSTAEVRATGTGGRAGGLAGTLLSNGSMEACWAAGRVTGPSGANRTGGLVAFGAANSVENSYWDTGVSGQSASSGGGTGKTTRELQQPTGYSGIYASWNLNLDGNAGGENPWRFGTTRQYPALGFTGVSTQRTWRPPAFVNADNGDAPVVGEPVVAGLHSKTSRAAVSPSATITTCDGVTGTTSRQAWTWQRSDDGRTSWTTVTSTNGPSCGYVYVPSSTDVGKYLRATVPRTSGGAATTLHTAPVVAASAATAATATFASGNASPVVGTDVVVSALPRPRTDRTVWRWQRCTANDGTGCTLLAPVNGRSGWTYRPVAADVGNYLRAFVYYSNSSGTWTRAATAFTGAVASN